MSSTAKASGGFPSAADLEPRWRNSHSDPGWPVGWLRARAKMTNGAACHIRIHICARAQAHHIPEGQHVSSSVSIQLILCGQLWAQSMLSHRPRCGLSPHHCRRARAALCRRACRNGHRPWRARVVIRRTRSADCMRTKALPRGPFLLPHMARSLKAWK